MNEYVLEMNTLPGMTSSSLLPKVAAHAGYDFAALCQAILESARLDSGMGMQTLRESALIQAQANVWEEAAVEEAAFEAQHGYSLVPASRANSAGRAQKSA
jgi:hypothetical protein